MRDTWQSEGAPIVIGRLKLFAIGGTTRSSDHHQTATIVRDLSTRVESPGASDLHRADGSGSRGAQ